MLLNIFALNDFNAIEFRIQMATNRFYFQCESARSFENYVSALICIYQSFAEWTPTLTHIAQKQTEFGSQVITDRVST